MSRVISNECISCGCCAKECPVNAVVDSGVQYEIEASECIDCGVCDDICPTQAISES